MKKNYYIVLLFLLIVLLGLTQQSVYASDEDDAYIRSNTEYLYDPETNEYLPIQNIETEISVISDQNGHDYEFERLFEEKRVSNKEFAASSPKYTIDTAYQYPVTWDSEEWKNFNNVIEKREACYVSPELLRNMTTLALVETVVKYPLLVDIFAFDTIEMGIDWVSDYFVGIDELFSREDAIECLLEYSAVICEDDEYSDFYKSSIEIIVKVLDGRENEDNNVPSFRYTNSYVYTPNGSQVQARYGYTWSDWGMTSGDAMTAHNAVKSAYPNAVEITNANPSYNCHSYAWHQQSSLNNYWISDPSAYMTDGSYSASTPVAGRKITYKQNGILKHSGVVEVVGPTTDTTYVTSKWSWYGLFYHKVNDCPYYVIAQNISYWKLN